MDNIINELSIKLKKSKEEIDRLNKLVRDIQQFYIIEIKDLYKQLRSN